LNITLGKIGDLWRKGVALSISMILFCVCTFLLIRFNNFGILVLASFLGGASYSIGSLVNSVVSVIAPAATRERWLSIQQSLGILAAFFSPFIGVLLYEASIYRPFIAVIPFSFILCILPITKIMKD
jgi:MFS family permease